MDSIRKILHVGFLFATLISTSTLLYRVLTKGGDLKEIFIVVLVFGFMSLLTSKYTGNE